DRPLGDRWRLGHRATQAGDDHHRWPGLRLGGPAGDTGRGTARYRAGRPEVTGHESMNALIDLCVARSRAVMVALVVLLVAGALTYRSLPKEMEPDIDFPYVSVEVFLEGISAEDSERLLVRPVEQPLRNVVGIQEMVA